MEASSGPIKLDEDFIGNAIIIAIGDEARLWTQRLLQEIEDTEVDMDVSRFIDEGCPNF